MGSSSRRGASRVGGRSALAGVALAAIALAACGLAPPEDPPEGTALAPPPPVDPVAPGVPPPGYALVWEDGFDGTAIDARRWTAHDEPRRDARSTPEAVAVDGGVLRITTYTDAEGHKSGFLSTTGKLEFTYGYFEARIRFSGAPGEWCAFWLDSPTNGNPDGDPGRAGVEIDVIEHRTTDGLGWAELPDVMWMSLNWDRHHGVRKNVHQGVHVPEASRPLEHAWHVYAVHWTPEGYTFYLDGTPLWTTDAAISHRSEYVLLTCEVDDREWAGNVPADGYPAREESTVGMEVDWIRVWQAP